MKKLDRNAYQEIRAWVHRNARPLELALWEYFLEIGDKESVVNALSYYQNEDGGFGHGLEPDCWNTESSPYETFNAISILRNLSYIEEKGTDNSLVQGIFRYLDSGDSSDENGWFFSIPSNDNFPRAPWWSYSEESNRVQNMGLTASICAFVLRYAPRQSNLFAKACTYTRNILKNAESTEEFGEMGAGGILMLLGDIMQSGLSSEFPAPGLMEKMAGIVNQRIERDPQKWAFYTPRPSEFIPSAQSPFYSGNEEIVTTELDYLIDTRNPGGVWNITWTWFDLGEKYAKEFAVSENWWMAIKAIDKVMFLKNFGRVEQ